MNGESQFSLCYSSASLATCMQAGRMNVTQTQCATTFAPAPGTTDPNSIPLASNSLLGASGIFTGDDLHDWAILAAILFFLLLIILIICCLCCWKRGVVPPDHEADEKRKKNPARPGEDDGYQTQDADSFALLFAANRTESVVQANAAALAAAGGDHHHVSAASPGGDRSRGLDQFDYYAITGGLPIRTTLDLMHEPTDETRAIEGEERRVREDLTLCEQFLFEKMRKNYVSELRGLAAVAVGSDRTRIIREGNQIHREQRERFCDMEEEARDEVRRLEGEAFYEISKFEREGFRESSGHDRDLLNAAWAGEEDAWSVRRANILKSGHGALIEGGQEDAHDYGPGSNQTSPMRYSVHKNKDGLTPNTNARGGGQFSPMEEQAPVPPLAESAITSPQHPGSRTPFASSGGGGGDLPSGPQPSPPPLAIKGDPLLHFTVPPPSQNMLNRGINTPSASATQHRHHHQQQQQQQQNLSGTATPFRDPFAPLQSPHRGTNSNNQTGGGGVMSHPLHQALTPAQRQQNPALHQGITPPHTVEESQDDIFYPSHASRPQQQQQNTSGGTRWGAPSPYSGSAASGGRRTQDPANFESYTGPRR